MSPAVSEDFGRQEARRWLSILLDRAERSEAGGSSRAVVSNEAMLRSYKSSHDVDFRRGVHEFLDNVRVREAVKLIWEPHYEGHDLKKVRVLDLCKLRELLGANSLADLARNAIQAVLQACVRNGTTLNPLLTPLLDELAAAWRLGRPAFGLRAESTADAEIAFKTVAAILEGENLGLDMRTFSVRVHGHSKIVENNRRAVERLLQTLFPPEDGHDFDVLSYLGLEKTPQPFFLGGRHCVNLNGQKIHIPIYLGFPRATVSDAEIGSDVSGFLIIENWTTFDKAAVAVPGQWLVLYCGGFPSSGWIEVARRLLDQCPDVPVLHWGDVDLGGFRIFEHLYARLSDRLRPYWMSPAVYSVDSSASSLSDGDRRELHRIATRIPVLQGCVDEITSQQRFGLEQEAIQIPKVWHLESWN